MAYQTKPLDCWQKAKELRAQHYQDIMTAREQGKLLVTGGAAACYEILCGLGDFEYFGGEPYGAAIGYLGDGAVEYAEAAEERGYARDLCAYMRLYWGSMFLDRGPFGAFPRPDFAFQFHLCDSHVKWFQVVSEHLGIPFICLEEPLYSSTQGKEHNVDYLYSQFQEFILWAESITGRKWDDEKLIQGLSNTRKCQVLWAQICELNKAVPAPLDQKSMYTLYLPAVEMRTKKQAVEFYQMLKDEVEDRVANQIAALGNERCRLMHDNIPPWFALHIFRHCEKYGAVFIGSPYCFMWGAFGEREDGTWGSLKTLEESGELPRDRHQALRLLARWYSRGGEFWGWPVHSRIKYALNIAQGWKVDGAIFHHNRGCEGLSLGQKEIMLALSERLGLPVISYEGNSSDKREFNQAQVLDQLDSFLESLGLRKLADWGVG